MQRIWFKTALFNLFIAACIGALLRYAFVEEISWLKFQYWLHAHSHIAMLGWVYLGLFSLFVHSFLPEAKQKSKFYNRLFWFTQFTIAGMLVAFSLEGYSGWAITFSTLHVLLSYVFVRRFWKDLNVTCGHLNESYSRPSVIFVRAAMLFMLLSTLALWTLSLVISSGKTGSAVYYGTIQFYLHFQFNGWFIFSVLGLLFKLFEEKNVSLPARLIKIFYGLLVISCIITFALAVTWSTPLPFLFFVNSIGVTIQLGALIVFILIVKPIWNDIKTLLPTWILILFLMALLSFVLKILIQAVVVIPHLATMAYTIRNYVVGFLHLLLLGVVTCFLLGYGSYKDLLKLESIWSKIGIVLFMGGFLLSESILFIQGSMFWGTMGFLPYYYEVLFGVTLVLPIGIGMVWVRQLVH